MLLTEYAEQVAELESRVASLEVERQSYREVAQAAIHALHELSAELDLTNQHYVEMRAAYCAELRAARRGRAA